MIIPGKPGDWLQYEEFAQSDGTVVGTGVQADGYVYFMVRDEAGSAWRPPVKVTPA